MQFVKKAKLGTGKGVGISGTGIVRLVQFICRRPSRRCVNQERELVMGLLPGGEGTPFSIIN